MSSAYVDSSVILRSLLRETDRTDRTQFRSYSRLMTSEITDIECRRVLDRVRIEEDLSDAEVAMRYIELENVFEAFDVIDISRDILTRAREPFPTVVRTLDAIHLSSAILVRKVENKEMYFVTFDQQQLFAAQALGFRTNA